MTDIHPDEHAAHYYPALDRDFNVVPSKNPLDDLACFGHDAPMPWLECHNQRLRAEVLTEAADDIEQSPLAVVPDTYMRTDYLAGYEKADELTVEMLRQRAGNGDNDE
jgi:hypothetical protein